jgi:multiple antibiotic resistance protein
MPVEGLLESIVILWAVIDPIGTIPVFISATDGMSPAEKRKVALLSSAIAYGILLFFIIVGEILLKGMAVPLPAFQVSGGIILFLFALTMIFGDSKPDEEVAMAKSVSDTAVFPLATPSIASPGAIMAVVLLTENGRHPITEQLGTALITLGVVACAMLCMLFAGVTGSLIGRGGASIVSRVMGLILASVAATNVLAGIKEYFFTAPVP